MTSWIVKVICIFLSLSSICGIGYTQDFNQTLDDKYTPPEGSVFYTDEKAAKKKSNRQYANLLAINLTAPLRGAVLLQYQRRLSSNLAIEIGAGVSTLPPVIYFLRQELYSGSNNDLSDFVFGDYSISPQICFTGAILYYLDEALTESYIGLEYRRFNYELNYDSDYRAASPFGATVNPLIAVNDFQIKYGGTIGERGFISQMYIGTGMRYGYEEYPRYAGNGFSGNLDYYSIEQTTIIQFLMTVGVTLGPRF